MVVIWAPQAELALKKLFDYINQDSPQAARKVIIEILAITDKLIEYPEMFPPDKYKKSNDGNWRAFEKYHYRISYRVTKNAIRIVRLRHTSRTPRNY